MLEIILFNFKVNDVLDNLEISGGILFHEAGQLDATDLIPDSLTRL